MDAPRGLDYGLFAGAVDLGVRQAVECVVETAATVFVFLWGAQTRPPLPEIADLQARAEF